MTKQTFHRLLLLFALLFAGFFMGVVLPPLLDNPDVLGAFMAGFVNPYSSGYSFDVIVTWFILAAWVLYESPTVRHGWVCLILGVVPGVAVGLAAYLILRESRFGQRKPA